jgi:hypothetical protein
MSLTFRVGNYIDPSGFGLAVVDIPDLDPEKNISLIDYSHKWEENVASSDRNLMRSYVDNGGHMPALTVTDFLVTNATTMGTNDIVETPLFYRHRCRFHHWAYGENPNRQVYVTDQDGNILKDIHYLVTAERVIANVYRIDVLTDFYSNEYTQYKVKYNRCLIDGSQINPGWTENLNVEPLLKPGDPFASSYEYALWGPDDNGMYSAIVPPVPTLSSLVNSIGISFENSPVIIRTDVTNNVSEYAPGVVVVYTLKATGPATFTVKRSSDRYGFNPNTYLQSLTADTWTGAPYNFTKGDIITGIYGMVLEVHGDNYFNTGDEAYFTAKRSYYYLMPISYSAIYLKKPEHVTPSDDWYIRVKNGRFRRRMNSLGEVVPSGYAGSTLFEYAIPEYSYQMWDLTWGPPYRESINERVELIDKQTIQVQRTPMFIDPASVLYNTEDPGFSPTGYLSVSVNDTLVPPTGVLDWDVYNGTVKLAQLLTHKDDIIASYIYKEEFYEYTGFVGSGGIDPVVPPFPFYELDLNPTPSHNYGLYASGTIAHMFLKPYSVIDDGPGGYGQPTVICNDAIYHNFTGVPSGVYDFKLGLVALGPHCKISDLEVTDVRTRGGGLSKMGIRDIEKVKLVQPETEFFWDVGYFDGQAVPANGVLVVRIPKRILISNGGMFGQDEVEQKVKKHCALGEYAIIEYI